MKTHIISILLATSSLLACQLNPVVLQEATSNLEILDLDRDITLGYSLQTMAWDGKELWQVIQENEQSLLVAQSPLTQKARAIKLNKKMPKHTGMTFGLGSFWLLDYEDKLYQISPRGEVLNEFQLESQDVGAILQITSHDEQLWVLHRSYVSKEAKQEDAFFMQIDPKSGKTLKTLTPSTDRLSGFLVPNLSSHNGFFYVARSNVVRPDNNILFRVNIQSGELIEKKLDKTYTGLTTLFFQNNKLFAIETLDLGEECADNCKGRIQQLPLIE